jgi:hypothetical protein
MTSLSVTARKTTGSRRFWSRATQVLGKVWAEVISLPERLPRAPERDFTDYPRFPMF